MSHIRRSWRAALVATLCLGALGLGATAAQAGPVVLVGIDAEDGGVGAHGPIAVYRNVITNGVLANVTNGGSDTLVIGGGKSATDQVTTFWNAVDAGVPGTVTYVNGASAIGSVNFSGFAAIAVVSTNVETPSGGLTHAENTALAGRQADITAFVNGGGGLFGLSQTGLPTPPPKYAYIPDADLFTFNTNQAFSNITPTLAGQAVGITDQLDVCCWHDEYLTYPSYLNVLATNAANGRAVALGGSNVILPSDLKLTPPTATNPVGTPHTVTANIARAGTPQPGILVTFSVTGVNAGATGTCSPADCRTDANGNVSFTYTGTAAGDDTIEATATSATGAPLVATAQKTWIAPARISISDVSVVEGNSGTTPAVFKVMLDQASGAPVTVDYITDHGTATGGVDFVGAGGTLTFAPGETSKDVIVLVRGDTVNEPDETFVVNLSGASGATIADPQGVGTIIDDERDGAFSCRASAARIDGLVEPTVANAPNAPCRDATAFLLQVVLNPSGPPTTVQAPNAKTDQTPDDLASAAPAIGDRATAHADTLAATIGGFGISAASTESDARAQCTSTGVPVLTGSSKVVGLRVGTTSYPVLTQPITVPLLLATVRINATIRTAGRITQRAIWVDSPLLPDVVVGEAIADFSGNPCDS